jgi:hypothetical protein
MEPVQKAMEVDHGWQQGSNIGTKSKQCREKEQKALEETLDELVAVNQLSDKLRGR